jgi:hypothetical protein
MGRWLPLLVRHVRFGVLETRHLRPHEFVVRAELFPATSAGGFNCVDAKKRVQLEGITRIWRTNLSLRASLRRLWL